MHHINALPVRPEEGRAALSREQQEVLTAILDGIKQGRYEQTIGGYAGTGKTTLITEMVARTAKACVVAPTGRAASVLRQKGVAAETIHSTIYRPLRACGGQCFRRKVECYCCIVGWGRTPRLPYKLIVCDEASMVQRDVHADLMAYGIPLVFVGDHGQLPPVCRAGEAPFNLMEHPEYRLEHIHRNGGEIARFAQHLRNGEPASSFRPRDNSVSIVGGDAPPEQVPIIQADRIIVATNKRRVLVNAYHRRQNGRMALVEPGECVMCLRNDRQRGLSNGTLARVLSVYGWRFDLDSEEGLIEGVTFDPGQFGSTKPPETPSGNGVLPFDYGYCSTCHKAQGGEWPYVIVIEENLGGLWEHRRWCYTAASRAQRALLWVAS
jgi:exodeoxyribonuclease-5